MTLEHGPLLAEGVQHFHGEEAAHGQGGVLRRADVTLAHDKAVAVFPLGVFWVDVHLTEVAGGDELGDGQRAAGVAGLRLVYHVDDVLFKVYAGVLKLSYAHLLFHVNHLSLNRGAQDVKMVEMPGMYVMISRTSIEANINGTTALDICFRFTLATPQATYRLTPTGGV